MDIKRVEKPWGHELWWAHTHRYVGKVLHVKAGHRLSLQYHVKKDETIHLQSGELVLVVDEGAGLVEKGLLPGESYRIGPGTVHRMVAVTDCDILEVSTPRWRTWCGSRIRTEGRPGRRDRRRADAWARRRPLRGCRPAGDPPSSGAAELASLEAQKALPVASAVPADGDFAGKAPAPCPPFTSRPQQGSHPQPTASRLYRSRCPRESFPRRFRGISFESLQQVFPCRRWLSSRY